jgi:iron complex outermembrane receptor protein
LLRETFSEGIFRTPDFSGTLRYKASPERNIFLKTSFSRNSKLPSMNDLFWYPGGNPGLRSEYAYQYEAGADWNYSFAGTYDLGIDLNCFHNRIHDMIQWLPGSFSYWEPVNVKNTSTTGAEVSASFTYKTENLQWSARGDYSFTSARNTEPLNASENQEWHQLVYVPANKAGLLLSASAGRLSAAFGSTYTGKRYTTADNSRFLPQYWESFVSVTCKAVVKQVTCNVNLSVDNVFNTEYQLLAYYPMPGRSFSLRVSFTF